MHTDGPPRKSNLAEFQESDRITALELPQDECLPRIARAIESAMKSEQTANVRRVCSEFLNVASQFYRVPDCSIRVLAARPLQVRERWATELFGDYDPDSTLIRVWLRTAVRKEITCFGTFLSTVCHEFSHHLDYQKFRFGESWHTPAGFTREPLCSTIMRGELRRSACFGRRCPVSAGGLIGRERIEAQHKPGHEPAPNAAQGLKVRRLLLNESPNIKLFVPSRNLKKPPVPNTKT
jgi:hypothetical protein